MKYHNLPAAALTSIIALTACGGDDPGPLEGAGDITLRNTLEENGGPETAFPALFELPDDTFDEFGSFSNDASEFPTALAQPDTPFGDISGLYDIDLTADRIEFTLLPTADDPFWMNVFEVFPAGKFDRYYLTFDAPHGVEDSDSDDDSVRLHIDSPTVLVVEISEGYDMNPGAEFTIDLS
ncbi:MAG: hypothetical protein AAFP84_19360 [Actinomycetota bacterium]